MSNEALEYKCPSCDAALRYGAVQGEMVCGHCGNTYKVADLDELRAATAEAENEKDDYTWRTHADTEQEGDYTAFVCPSCGAEIVSDGTTAATECVYCGNPSVLTKRLSGIYKPDYIIPFSVDKNAAKDALLKLCRGKPLLPKSFLAENRVEKITGMYVPYWLFDCTANARAAYAATRVHTHSDSRYIYTRTDHFLVTRAGNATFTRLPADGSSKLGNEYTEAIEPYDYKGMKSFANPYLSGFFADKYDVSSNDCIPRVNERIRSCMSDSLRSTVRGYATVVETSSGVRVRNGNISYALLPIWMLNTVYRGKTYTFAVNGQTGKMVGDLPVSPGRFFALYAALAGAVAVIGTLIALFI